ncbi:glycosyltransferase [Coraliomargarita algicola]|uniref:Glycosyltransferase n=1 Tax=Coraliomargarita algicola TaxID=3092156 RepID=A0ABZ0RKS0_9BACT|nr:glycosyltransferase [Coraliomargarita sp. J2-16]WPJ96810.1 glycosyltransferase [Coraliomargarita sp. J2-16]
MKPIPDSITLVMRSYNEAWAIEDTLKAVCEQDYTGQIELIVIDSGSTDGSHEIIRNYKPKEFIILEPGTYVPGKVLNQGFRLAQNEWVVFLNSDATPDNAQWLKQLLQAAVNTPRLGAAFSRQIPRNDCQAVFAHDYDRCFGPHRESDQWEHFFSMVSCVARKSVWKEYPIREDLQYAEDDEWTRRMKDAGYETLLVVESVVMHSHNYTPAQSYKRAKGDALAVAQAGNVPETSLSWPLGVVLPAVKDSIKDFKYCLKQRRLNEVLHAFRVRYQQRLGRIDGYKEGMSDG